MKKVLVLLGLGLFTVLLQAGTAMASSAPTKLFISGTTLTINGHASPKALIEIKQDGAIIGTTIADNTGYFTKYFSAADPGINTLAISYKDIFGTNSDTVTRTINIKAQKNTSLYYYLPPSLSLSNNNIIEGTNQSVFGYTRPFANVEIVIDGGAQILRPRADQNGYYSIAFSTKNYYSGRHLVAATSRYENEFSTSTTSHYFNVSGNLPKVLSRELTPPEFTVDNPLISSGSATITGLAAPNSQILIFQDGTAIGSTFTNSEGNWAFQFNVTGNSSLQAIACYGEDCSARSDKLNLLYKENGEQQCRVDFALAEYRFFNKNRNQEVGITLNAINATPPLVIEVNWGDGETSQLTHDSTNALDVSHIYSSEGQFNATVSVLDEANCGGTRYFSVEVDNSKRITAWFWTLPALLGVSAAAYIKLRHSEINKEIASQNLDKI